MVRLHLVAPMTFGDFVQVDMEPGTYQSRWHPVLNTVVVKQKPWMFVTLYVWRLKGVQICWAKDCQCPACKKNRMRALLFLKPIDPKGKS